ncbi:reverse transcriptase domain-containing protein [Asaia sp. As-1742]|uniref:reverse transcriptase domain-containing protein n=1 Tax=Asaia sp. As-1742 TaxID=2608325 RepID=UPI001420FBC2|nr:reverse transcriptase domain-containing protein [Asaia sp. As-1742]
MQPTTVEKRLGSIINLSRQGKRVNGLFRLLGSPHLRERAYEQIASNKGATTPGIDPQNTLDSFSLARMNRIMTSVLQGTYRFSPARRQYIPKPNGTKRPLGIPTADDKLVQAVVKIVLEQIYEPVFSTHSHGFRQGRSCHTALTEIRNTWHGVKWLIEIDIVGYYDNIDHDILLNLLRRRIDDERLISLIGRMLKAGYLDNWTFHRTFSGAPQGGVISPILANIYLHELDEFMQEMMTGFNKGKTRRRHLLYSEIQEKIKTRRSMIKRRRARNEEDEVPGLIAQIKELEKRRRQTPSTDAFDPDYRRLKYCRYADDFVIGVIGSKEDARNILSAINAFLHDRLRLSVSQEKSGISKATEGGSFLGYTLKTFGDGRARRMVRCGRAVTMRIAGDRMQLHVPEERLARFADRQNLGTFYTNRGHARGELINNSDIAILAGYNALMRGIAEYYRLGTIWKRQVNRLHHLWWWSLMKSLAQKHKCSVRKTVQRLRRGNDIGLWYEGRRGRRFMKMVRLKDVRPNPASGRFDHYPQTATYFCSRTDTMDRLRAQVCEFCGRDDAPVEVHHSRRLSDMQGTTLWTYLKAARERKRIVLCRECHVAHHADGDYRKNRTR